MADPDTSAASPPTGAVGGRPSRCNAAAKEAARADVRAMSRLERMALALSLGRRHAELMRLRASDKVR
jgi:hypothetical protein